MIPFIVWDAGFSSLHLPSETSELQHHSHQCVFQPCPVLPTAGNIKLEVGKTCQCGYIHSASSHTHTHTQVRSCAMETIVEIYRHVGVKVRIDLSRRGIPSSRMSVLTTRFDEIDATSNTVHSDNEVRPPLSHISHSLHTLVSSSSPRTLTQEVDDDRESLSSCGSSASARTYGSSRSVGSRSARTAPSTSSRPPSVAGGGGGSGGLEEADFERGFQDTPHVNVSECVCVCVYIYPQRWLSKLLYSQSSSTHTHIMSAHTSSHHMLSHDRSSHSMIWSVLLPPLLPLWVTLRKPGSSESVL